MSSDSNHRLSSLSRKQQRPSLSEFLKIQTCVLCTQTEWLWQPRTCSSQERSEVTETKIFTRPRTSTILRASVSCRTSTKNMECSKLSSQFKMNETQILISFRSIKFQKYLEWLLNTKLNFEFVTFNWNQKTNYILFNLIIFIKGLSIFILIKS